MNFIPTGLQKESSFKQLPNIMSIFRSISVFIIALLFFPFCSNLLSVYAALVYPVTMIGRAIGAQSCKFSRLHKQILLCCFCCKSLRCATSNTTKNVACACATLSILASQGNKACIGYYAIDLLAILKTNVDRTIFHYDL